MKIAIDIDDVLADLLTPLTEFHNDRYGTDLSVEDVEGYDLAEAWGCSDEEHRHRIDEFLATDRILDIEPLEDAVGVVDILQNHHELYVLTARKPDIARERTEAWIEQEFPDTFTDVLFSEHEESKAVLCDEYGIDLLVDDNPLHIDACSDYDVTGVLFGHAWNADANLPDNVPRVHNWSQVLQLVRNIENFSRV